MNCERCSAKMDRQYEVNERYNRFTLWDCQCGNKVLERKRMLQATGADRPSLYQTS
jgi:hypothetical protein